MCNLCDKCELTQDYLPVGNCPACGAENLMMNNKTSTAICEKCGESFGIPRARERLCEKDVSYTRYTVTIQGTPAKKELLQLARIVGTNTVSMYQGFHDQKAVFHQLSMIQAFRIEHLFASSSCSVSCTPALKEYKNFVTCWHINLE